MVAKPTIRKFKMLYFRNERHHATKNLKKEIFLGVLQSHIDENSGPCDFGLEFL